MNNPRPAQACRKLTIFCLSVVALAFPPKVKGDEQDKKTTVTFTAPVEIPGVGAQTLPAGTYVIKLLDSASDRNIVQILNEDQTHVFATILAIPNYRLRPTDQTVMTFKERAEGQPEAIRAWFYPGEQWGQEFVYPKTRAVELAKLTDLPVLAMPAELAPDIVAPVKSVEEAPVVALKAAPVTAVKPTGEEVEVAEFVAPPPAKPALAANGEPLAPCGADRTAVAGRRLCSLESIETNRLSHG
ncbi:MAG: hypothetical protein ACLQOO_04230 [Terriglobia bacterium]